MEILQFDNLSFKRMKNPQASSHCTFSVSSTLSALLVLSLLLQSICQNQIIRHSTHITPEQDTDDATAATSFSPLSPLYQRLPDCRDEKNFVRISKKTTEKGLICPMFRDEEGFLAEFVV